MIFHVGSNRSFRTYIGCKRLQHFHTGKHHNYDLCRQEQFLRRAVELEMNRHYGNEMSWKIEAAREAPAAHEQQMRSNRPLRDWSKEQFLLVARINPDGTFSGDSHTGCMNESWKDSGCDPNAQHLHFHLNTMLAHPDKVNHDQMHNGSLWCALGYRDILVATAENEAHARGQGGLLQVLKRE
jgi:hypothetical protein